MRDPLIWIAVAVSVVILLQLIMLAAMANLWQRQREILALLGVGLVMEKKSQAEVGQRRATEHQASPPVKILDENDLVLGWQARCSCGFETGLYAEGLGALDALEGHKRLVSAVRRRAG